MHAWFASLPRPTVLFLAILISGCLYFDFYWWVISNAITGWQWLWESLRCEEHLWNTFFEKKSRPACFVPIVLVQRFTWEVFSLFFCNGNRRVLFFSLLLLLWEHWGFTFLWGFAASQGKKKVFVRTHRQINLWEKAAAVICENPQSRSVLNQQRSRANANSEGRTLQINDILAKSGQWL